MENITDINQIKMAVLQKIAEHAYDGVLEDKKDEIPYEITDPIKPSFRCCVYREREILRQRVRLGMGRLPAGLHYKNRNNSQIVYVMKAACEGCPIDRFTVTNNCHNCLAQKCIKACKFGAITKTPHGAYIDKSKCRKCGQCVKACPYNAIVDIERPCIKSCPVEAVDMDDNDLAKIDESKCLNCGQCVQNCPFGAIGVVSMMTNVISSITRGRPVYAMIAPAIEGQFGSATVPALIAAIKDLGFKDCYEVALGADAVAWREAEELAEKILEGKKMTTSCCPAFYNMIQKHYPEIKDCVSTTVSPMVATARLIRSKDPEAEIVFIGPCIAKKNEVVSRYLSEINAAMTFDELGAMFAAKNIDPESYKAEAQEATRYGKGFARSGGVSAAVAKVFEEKGLDAPRVKACNGWAECKVALQMLKLGRLTEDIVEGMNCEGGCVNGPCKQTDLILSKRVFDKNVNVDKTEIVQNCMDNGFENIEMHKH